MMKRLTELVEWKIAVKLIEKVDEILLISVRSDSLLFRRLSIIP